MRKFYAVLLATVITMTLTPVSIFAATNNYVDNRLTVPSKTAVMEHGVLPSTHYLLRTEDIKVTAEDTDGDVITTTLSGGSANYYVDGTDLVVPLKSDVQPGYQFKLTLANAS